MRDRCLWALALLMAACAAVLAAEGRDFHVGASLEQSECAPGGSAALTVRFTCPPEHYVWRDSIRLSLEDAPDGFSLGGPNMPEPKEKYDRFLEREVRYYDGEFQLSAALAVGPQVKPGDYGLSLVARYNGCSPELCLLKTERVSVQITVLARPGAVPAGQEGLAGPVGIAVPSDEATAPLAAGHEARDFAGHGPLVAVLLAFVAGLGLTLTPCVYPLIPVTVSLVGATAGRGRADALVRSLIYVFGISVTYSLVGVAAAATGSMFGAWLQHPALYLALAVVFALLACAMFDVYSLDIVSQRLQRFQAALRGRAGLVGIWLIGLLSGAAVTACIAPVVLGVLVYVAQRGSLWLGFAMFFALAWGMGTPLVLVGTFGGLVNALPRSGAWMVAVKRAFGLALFGVALYFVSRSHAVPRFWFQMLVGAFLLVSSVLVGALTPPGSGRLPRLRRVVGLLLFAGAVVAFAQPVLERVVTGGAPQEAGIEWVESEQEAPALARERGQPVLMDFWADWCAPCHRMFATTFADSRVVAESRRFVCARIDVTALSDADWQRLGRQYGVRGVPAVVLIDSSGQLGSHAGYVGPDEMLAIMQAVH